MPTQHPETIAFLQELKTPTHHTPAAMKAFSRGSAAILTKEGQQIALLRGLLDEVGENEDDANLAGKIETIIQQLDARARITSEITLRQRKLRGTTRDLVGYIQDFRAAAVAAGYTLP